MDNVEPVNYKERKNMLYYQEFTQWLDGYLCQTLPKDIVAFCFVLYEGGEYPDSARTWHIQLVGTSRFNENDDDWACDGIYSTGEDVFLIPRKDGLDEWEQALVFSAKLFNEYLEKGTFSEKLKNTQAVAYGFADGDLYISYRPIFEK